MSTEPAAKTYSITDLAREFGLTTRAIRFYEDKGLLAPRREGQRRIYGARERVRLDLILRGKRLGFSLAEIDEILGLYDQTGDDRAQLRLLVAKLEERQAALLRQRADIDVTLAEMGEILARCRTSLA